MRNVTLWLLWLYVFTVPWDMVTLPGVGTLSRSIGLLAIASGVMTSLSEGRFSRPDPVFLAATAFTATAAVSLLWSISPEATAVRVTTYAQLLASVWLVREFSRTREERESLLVAFCCGAFVPMTELLDNFRSNRDVWFIPGRFSGAGLNANDLGLTLVMGIPMAWRLLMGTAVSVRLMAGIYFVAAPVAILLTGTRGAFLTGLVALAIVPLTLRSLSLHSVVKMTIFVFAMAVTAAFIVPSNTWQRISTIRTEILEGGTMSGRTDIWKAGWQLFPEHPLLGVGAGAYGVAVEPVLNKSQSSHNVPLGILIELGLVGLTVFTALIVTCAWNISDLPRQDRILWVILGLSWLVGVMSLNWEYRKVTWLFIGLLSAQAASRRRAAAMPTALRGAAAVTSALLGDRRIACGESGIRRDRAV